MKKIILTAILTCILTVCIITAIQHLKGEPSALEAIQTTNNLENVARDTAVNFLKEECMLYQDQDHMDKDKLKLMVTDEIYNNLISDRYPSFDPPEKLEGYVFNVDHVICNATPTGYQILITGSETFKPLTYPFSVYIEMDENNIITKYEKHVYESY
jgi:hypothetical protein